MAQLCLVLFFSAHLMGVGNWFVCLSGGLFSHWGKIVGTFPFRISIIMIRWQLPYILRWQAWQGGLWGTNSWYWLRFDFSLVPYSLFISFIIFPLHSLLFSSLLVIFLIFVLFFIRIHSLLSSHYLSPLSSKSASFFSCLPFHALFYSFVFHLYSSPGILSLVLSLSCRMRLPTLRTSWRGDPSWWLLTLNSDEEEQGSLSASCGESSCLFYFFFLKCHS